MPQHAWTQQWVTQGVAKGREQGSRSRDVEDTGHSPARLGCYRLFQALAVLPHPVRHFRFGGLLPLLSPNFARRMINNNHNSNPIQIEANPVICPSHQPPAISPPPKNPDERSICPPEKISARLRDQAVLPLFQKNAVHVPAVLCQKRGPRACRRAGE